MKLFYALVLCFTAAFLQGQENFNLELVGQMDYTDINNENGNDIWGFEHSNGTEYAIVGTTRSTRIYDLSDPTAPREIIAIPGDQTTWRDMKNWGDYVYVSADNAGDGLLVIDMSEVSDSDSIRFQFLNPEVMTNNGLLTLASCHNIFIDENGFAYLAGCSTGMNKAVIFDLNVDPWTPPVVGAHGDNGADYAHDLMVKNNIMYSSEINVGRLALFDVTDKANIVELGAVNTSFNFTHNAWVSDDQNYVFTTDERGNAFVDSYDVSDPTNIRRLDLFQPAETAGNGVIPHNTHYIDGYVVTSWYTDGVVITDVSRPDNMIKVGAYDTFLGPDGGFSGCWGVHPWLPSGLILDNDINTGLYIFRPTYQRACYLEGNVVSAVDGTNINDASITIIDTDINTSSDVAGNYKTGLAQAGTYTVQFTHPLYNTLEIDNVELINGELTILDVELTQPNRATVSGMVIDAETGASIPDAQLVFTAGQRVFEADSDASGAFLLETFEEDYEVIVAAWGYEHRVLTTFNPVTDEPIFRLDFGYMDDFILDLGWTVDGNAATGAWVREVPSGTVFQGQPSAIGQDIEGDIGEIAYVTGNGPGGGGADDIDDGATTLTSPAIILDRYDNPVVEFRTYFFNAGGNGGAPNDFITVELTDGLSTVLLTEFRSDPAAGTNASTGDWTDVLRFNIEETGLDMTQPITISYTAADDDPGHLVEAAVDVFKVVEANSISTDELSELDFIRVFPNPADDILNISSTEEEIERLSLYNSLGQLVLQNGNKTKIDVSDLESGAYTLLIDTVSGLSRSTRVVIK